jgi:tetratricopeptide (TPR) repeat protein
MVLTETMMTPIRCAAITALLAWVLMMSAPRLAQAGPTPAEPAGAGKKADEADTLFHKGTVAFDAGKLDQAYPLFKAAWALKQTHDIAGNLAQVELALGKHRDAAEHIAYALAHFPPSIQSDRRDKMKKALDGLRQQLGVVTIKVNLPEANVSMDGKPIGALPIGGEVFVEPGAHTVKAELKNYPAVETPLQVGKGASHEVTLTLVQEKGAAPTPPELPPKKDEPQPGPNKAIVIAGAGASGAALIAGVVFTAVANGKARAADKLLQPIAQQYGQRACGQTPPVPGCDALHQAREPQYTFSNLALWSFVGAGVVGVGTAVYVLTAPRGAPKTAVRITPMAAARGGGFLVSGVW